jgi:hypothetical protein
MSLQLQIIALAQAIGTDVKSLRSNTGDLGSLRTTAKANIVNAINELADLIGNSPAGVTINDTSTTSTVQTWSANQSNTVINTAIATLRSELVGGASAALDTFKELQDALGGDEHFATTISTALGNRVRFDAAQTLTTAQQLQACTNIGIGNPETNFVSSYNAAKA